MEEKKAQTTLDEETGSERVLRTHLFVPCVFSSVPSCWTVVLFAEGPQIICILLLGPVWFGPLCFPVL